MTLNTDVCGIIAGYLDTKEPCNLSQKVDDLLQINGLCEHFGANKQDVSLQLALYRKEEKRAPTDPVAKKIARFVISAGKGKKKEIRERLKHIEKFDLSNQALPWQEPRYIAFSKGIEQAIRNNQTKMVDFLISQKLYEDMVNTKLKVQPLDNRQRRDFMDPKAILIRQRNHEATYKQAVAKEIINLIAKSFIQAGNEELLTKLFLDDYHRPDYDRSNSPLQKSINSLIETAERAGQESVKNLLLNLIDTSDPLN